MTSAELDLLDATLHELDEIRAVAALVGDGFDHSDEPEGQNLAAVFYMFEKRLTEAMSKLGQYHSQTRQARAGEGASASH